MKVKDIVTLSAPMPKPSWVKDDATKEPTSAADKHATIEETCPKCGNPEMHFYTMQLRSVDEGSTVFYECPVCNYTYSQNN